jgi:hypothetical protein
LELKSEPQYETVNVTDLTVAFPGDIQDFVLFEGKDFMQREGDLLELTFSSGGRVQLNLQHAFYVTERTRTQRIASPVVAPAAQAGKSADPQTPILKQTEQ